MQPIAVPLVRDIAPAGSKISRGGGYSNRISDNADDPGKSSQQRKIICIDSYHTGSVVRQ